MRIFLGNAPWICGERYGVRAGSRWPHMQPIGSTYVPFPFFLAYATTLLEKNGYQAKIVDGVAEKMSEEEFITQAIYFKPDLVLLETSTPSIEIDLRIAKRIKENCSPTPKIAFSGPHVSVFLDKFLEEHHFIDYVLYGEYEYTLLDLVNHLVNNSSLDDVKGLVYRLPTGEIKVNSRRELIMDLDKLPWPAYHQLPMYNYNDDFGVLPRPSVQMWASRGCPFQCIFCLWPQVIYGSNKYRVRNPVNVVDEMEWLVKTYGFKSVYFDDDTFDIGKERIFKLCEEIKKRNLKVPWAIMARADTLDREMLEEMASANLIALKYGIESADQNILNNSGKRLDLKKAIENIKITKELGIKIHLTFAFGLPGETKETIRKTIELALKLDPDSVQFSIITPFPGTDYYNTLLKKGFLLAKNWSDFDGNRTAVIRTENLSDKDLEEALEFAYQSWYNHLKKKRLPIYIFLNWLKSKF